MGHRGAEQEVTLGRGDLEQTERVGGDVQVEEAQVGLGGIEGRGCVWGRKEHITPHLGNCSPQLLSPRGRVDPISHPTPVLTASSLK